MSVEENAVEIRGMKELKRYIETEEQRDSLSASEGQRSCRHCTSNQIGKDPVIKV